jgi:hypothetical protein
MEVHGNFKWDNGPKNSWLLRCRGVGGASVNVSCGESDTGNPGGSDCGLVGCVYPDITTQNGDRIHISPDYNGSGHTPGHAMHNFTIDHCWIEGTIRPEGSVSHADTVQIDGLTGTYKATNSFFGPAGSNGTSQASADIFWSADGDFCSIVMDTCLLAGTSATSTTTGQGNSSSFSGPDTRTNCVFYNESSGTAFRFNTPLHRAYQGSTTPQVTLTNCTFYGSITGSGTGLTNTNPTMLSASNKGSANPGYVSPPWQWW